MANKLMQDVDDIESSSESEPVSPNNVINEERMKKEEIMANLKHLNLLGNVDPTSITSPSEIQDTYSPIISPKDNPSAD